MPLRFRHRILDHLSHTNYRPTQSGALRRDLRVAPDDREAFKVAIADLVEQGQIQIDDDGFVRLPTMGEEITGRFRLNARGFGFVIPEHPFREGDLFIPRGAARDAISGDTVRAAVQRGGRGRRGRSGKFDVSGRIVEVLERGQEHFVGTLQKEGRQWVVEPDGRSLHDAVMIRDPHAKNAKVGDKVVIELLHYPEDEYYAEGVIIKVLGESGRPDVETQAVIAAHGLRTDFPPEVSADAQKASSSFAPDDRDEREDLTDEFIFTIDPPDAKDFDDAISIAYDAEEKEWTLGVHIADVSSFVRPGTPLDVEAQARGNSVYLPRLVIPMLPETLSNGVCSLQEGVPRFAKSAFITFDARGRVISQRFASTVIKSRKRLTYLEAQALIDGDQREARTHARTEAVYTDELIDTVRRADRLGRLLEKRRARDGAIVLNLPDVELVFDDNGHVTDAVPEDDAYTHKIIEMFMVEANESVARLFDSLRVPMIRRIHPDPSFGDMEELRMYARAAGQHVPETPTRHDLQALLDATRETPASRAIHFAVLRTLTRASYSPAVIGHFALASEHYTHFTSPIRRYPDLIVHRALAAFLDLTENGRSVPGGRKRETMAKRLRDDTRVPDEAALITLGRHCSDTESEADAAERELRAFLVMQFLHEHHMGEEFTGVITGMNSGGVFISIERFLVEGMVKLDDLPGSAGSAGSAGRPDRWKVDESTGSLIARRSGAMLSIGDIVTVKIVAIDLASRHLDLLLTEYPERRASPKALRPKPASSPRHGSKKGKGSGYKKGRRGRRSR